MSARHELHASPETVHWGFFDSSLAPVLSVAPGERVTVHCVSGSPEVVPGPPFELPPELRAIHAAKRPHLGAHILTGPISVAGAEPGDALEVRILEVALRTDWGYTYVKPLLGTIPEDFPGRHLLHIPIDRKALTATLPWGTRIPLRPFFGVVGVAPPAAYGAIASNVPREHGGNLDNKELVAGTSLHLPVWRPGALVSVGDGHAVQGDGEVTITALETCLSGTFEFVLHKGAGLSFPRAETPTHHVTMGFDPDLDDAAKQALREMIRLIVGRTGLSPADAYCLCSLAVDFRVTQLVNGHKGVHAMIAKSLL
ncbi:MAG: acetamidase/formamidase family protein [Proteobacteria bacterium]|nr:acetamidase/formamidase family protein [Pseudomonadota bacterium]